MASDWVLLGVFLLPSLISLGIEHFESLFLATSCVCGWRELSHKLRIRGVKICLDQSNSTHSLSLRSLRNL